MLLKANRFSTSKSSAGLHARCELTNQRWIFFDLNWLADLVQHLHFEFVHGLSIVRIPGDVPHRNIQELRQAVRIAAEPIEHDVINQVQTTAPMIDQIQLITDEERRRAGQPGGVPSDHAFGDQLNGMDAGQTALQQTLGRCHQSLFPETS